jgi:N-acetylneuraminic acid mutarotase
MVLVFLAGVMTGLLARPRLADLLRPQYRALRGRFVNPEDLYGPAPQRRMRGVEIAPSPIPRFEAAAAVVGERLYLLGGFHTPDLKVSSRCDVYDPMSDSWTPLADMPLPVTHAGVTVANGEVWVAGGFAGDHPGGATAEVWRYNVENNSWTPGPSLPEPRGSGSLVELDGELHFFGGVKADRDSDASNHWVLRLEDRGGWQPRAPMLNARNHLSGVALHGKIHALGGQYRHDFAPLDIDLHEAYDPATDSWSRLAPLLRPRSHCEPGTFVHEGLIIIAGGRSNRAQVLYDIDAYDPAADRWRSLPALTIPMRAPIAKLLKDRIVAGAGGMPPAGTDPSSHLFSFPIGELELSEPPPAAPLPLSR